MKTIDYSLFKILRNQEVTLQDFVARLQSEHYQMSTISAYRSTLSALLHRYRKYGIEYFDDATLDQLATLPLFQKPGEAVAYRALCYLYPGLPALPDGRGWKRPAIGTSPATIIPKVEAQDLQSRVSELGITLATLQRAHPDIQMLYDWHIRLQNPAIKDDLKHVFLHAHIQPHEARAAFDFQKPGFPLLINGTPYSCPDGALKSHVRRIFALNPDADTILPVPVWLFLYIKSKL